MTGHKAIVQKQINPFNIIILSIDALRADHLGFYGYSRKTAPFLSLLSRQSSFFKNALSASCWTYPSIASMFTGLYPHNHGATFSTHLRNWFFEDINVNPPRKEVIFLSELLAYFGYRPIFVNAVKT